MAFITSLRRGDHLIWTAAGGRQVYIVVTRVARDTSWADLRMFTWAMSWAKRMPLPMPRKHVRFENWDSRDLARDAEAATKEERRDGLAA